MTYREDNQMRRRGRRGGKNNLCERVIALMTLVVIVLTVMVIVKLCGMTNTNNAGNNIDDRGSDISQSSGENGGESKDLPDGGNGGSYGSGNEPAANGKVYGEDGSDTDDKLAYILANAEQYPEKLVEQAQKNEEIVDFVYRYPVESSLAQVEADISTEAQSDTIPLLLQWDSRWGYQKYGDGILGYNGCGPLCLSMVAIYMTKDAEYTPTYVAEYSGNRGYYAAGHGTSWTLMSEGCKEFGLTAKELPLDKNTMVSALERGEPIICVLGPGDFTDDGHFIVLTGYTDDGFTINDPNSRIRSGQIWSYDKLKDQIRNIWAYTIEQ